VSDPGGMDALVEEFRRAYLAGERPDVRDVVEHVDEDQRDEMGRRIRLVLAEEPPPDPAPETVLMVQSMLRGQPPLLELRTTRGMTRDHVVARLRDELGLDAATEPRLAVFYHQLETGQLPLAPVRDRVFEAVARVMGVARAALLLTGPDPSGAAGGPSGPAVFARGGAGGPVAIDTLAALPGEPDEVDDLFTGGPG
jgi:hypothetical protein